MAEFLTALGTGLAAIAAFFAAWVAYRQSEVERANLKLALFERRLAVRNAAFEWLTTVLNGPHRDSQDSAFLAACTEAKWLFDSEIHGFLHDTLWQARCRFAELDLQIDAGEAPNLAELVQERLTLLKWLYAQRGELDKKLAPYLSFAAWK